MSIFIHSRTTKAFSQQITISACGCSDIFVRLMGVFLSSLEKNRSELLNGVRQYLHRMVVCLNGSIFLPFVAQIINRFLIASSSDIRALQEFLILLQQIVSKHKVSKLRSLKMIDVILAFA